MRQIIPVKYWLGLTGLLVKTKKGVKKGLKRGKKGVEQELKIPIDYGIVYLVKLECDSGFTF